MRPRTNAVVAAILLLTAGITVAPAADARAPPTPVCGVCDLDRTTSNGTSVVAGDSSLTITVHGDGSTTWAARIDLEAGDEALSANESLRRAVVDDAVRDGIADPSDVESRIDGDTLLVEYRDPDVTERHVGVVVFTPLTPASPSAPLVSGGEGPRYLGTDRLVVRGGDGWTVRGGASGNDASGQLVWTREVGAPDEDGRVFVDVARDPVAVEAGSVLPGLRARIGRLLTGNTL